MNSPKEMFKGFVRTQNAMGFMATALDEYAQHFLEFVPRASGPIVDIGAAYGIMTLALLERGARVIVIDSDSNHLDAIRQNVSPHLMNRLELKQGIFPDEIELPHESIGAIYLGRVLHFLDGPTLERGIQKLWKWLVPGGKVVATSVTPYINGFQSIAKIYEENRRNEELWPGFIEDVSQYIPVLWTACMPLKMHFLDQEVLTRVFTQAGFQIEKVSTFTNTHSPESMRLDGREYGGIIACKPEK